MRGGCLLPDSIRVNADMQAAAVPASEPSSAGALGYHRQEWLAGDATARDSSGHNAKHHDN